MVGRVPGVDDGRVHEPDVAFRDIPQTHELLLDLPICHGYNVGQVGGRVGGINSGIIVVHAWKQSEVKVKSHKMIKLNLGKRKLKTF